MAMSVEMLRLTGDSRVADELELSLFNSGFGMMSPSGRWVTYDTPMDGARLASAHSIVFQSRAGSPELNCCSVNGPRALGLTGEWADKPIIPYGLNLRYHQATVISDRVLKGSDKWNERLRIYANYVTPDGRLSRGLNEDLLKDKYGIAYIAAPTVTMNFAAQEQVSPRLKILPLAETAAGPYVEYTIETLQNRTYPLFDEVYFYTHALPGKGLDSKVREFLRFVLSREGQELIMKDGKYLPLTAKVAREQLAKLD